MNKALSPRAAIGGTVQTPCNNRLNSTKEIRTTKSSLKPRGKQLLQQTGSYYVC